MKKTKDNPVIITIKSKDYHFTARVPLWKAYFIAGEIERENEIKNKKKLQ